VGQPTINLASVGASVKAWQQARDRSNEWLRQESKYLHFQISLLPYAFILGSKSQRATTLVNTPLAKRHWPTSFQPECELQPDLLDDAGVRRLPQIAVTIMRLRLRAHYHSDNPRAVSRGRSLGCPYHSVRRPRIAPARNNNEKYRTLSRIDAAASKCSSGISPSIYDIRRHSRVRGPVIEAGQATTGETEWPKRSVLVAAGEVGTTSRSLRAKHAVRRRSRTNVTGRRGPKCICRAMHRKHV